MPYTLLNTLYVTTPGSYLRLENNTIRVELERQKRSQVPLHHIGHVVTFGEVMVSPSLLHRLADEGIGVSMLSRNGRFKLRLEGRSAVISYCDRPNMASVKRQRWT